MNPKQTWLIGAATVVTFVLWAVVIHIFPLLATPPPETPPPTSLNETSPAPISQSPSGRSIATSGQTGGSNNVTNIFDSLPKEGRRNFSEKRDPDNPITINIGGNICVIEPNSSETAVMFICKKFGDTTMLFGGSAPPDNSTVVKAKLVNGELYVDASLFSGDPAKPMLLIENQLQNRPPSWDVNSNGNQTLEVVDGLGTPVFQLIYTDLNSASINGIFSNQNGIVITSGRNSGIFLADVKTSGLTPLFKYPSFRHPGEFNQ